MQGMDRTRSGTPAGGAAALAQWYSLGPSRSAKRSLFSAATSRRPAPLDHHHDAVTSCEPCAGTRCDDGSDCWVGDAGARFNRSMSMRVRSSRHAAKHAYNGSAGTCHHTSVTAVDVNTTGDRGGGRPQYFPKGAHTL